MHNKQCLHHDHNGERCTALSDRYSGNQNIARPFCEEHSGESVWSWCSFSWCYRWARCGEEVCTKHGGGAGADFQYGSHDEYETTVSATRNAPVVIVESVASTFQGSVEHICLHAFGTVETCTNLSITAQGCTPTPYCQTHRMAHNFNDIRIEDKRLQGKGEGGWCCEVGCWRWALGQRDLGRDSNYYCGLHGGRDYLFGSHAEFHTATAKPKAKKPKPKSIKALAREVFYYTSCCGEPMSAKLCHEEPVCACGTQLDVWILKQDDLSKHYNIEVKAKAAQPVSLSETPTKEQ